MSEIRRAPLGWLSLATGVLVWTVPVLMFGSSILEQRRAMAASHGIGASAGGVGSWAICAAVVVLILGVAAALASIVRRESQVWVAIAGLLLNMLPLSLVGVTLILALR